MDFRYRYVGFGTNFEPCPGDRISCGQDDPPNRLHDNELVVDTGGVCQPDDAQQRSILDHHFDRKDGGQFPSAAAAVLHNARFVRERFSATQKSSPVLWLVTHQEADFDAFCAMYLARRILADDPIPCEGWARFGIGPEGWFGTKDEIDWFAPESAKLPEEYRWPVLLASCAACVDNCRRMSVPKTRALHSVLYAARYRGRISENETDGAYSFFAEVESAVRGGLNPLLDSVFENNPGFAHELALLDHEIEAYGHDIRRARKAMVFVQQTSETFPAWYGRCKASPLFAPDGKIATLQREPSGSTRKQVDGVYLRDPECLLFKEWARSDTENSSMGRGFLFTAIAYPGQRRGARCNTTDYFVSLDPERADGMHLYDVWSKLQSAEIGSIQLAEREAAHAELAEERKRIREGYEQRADQHALAVWFDDPWYDGVNYSCTIVATPNRGTFIGKPGQAADLSDDPVARIVRRALEGNVFLTRVQDDNRFGEYRFGTVHLADYVEIGKGQIADQIGRFLWRWLHGDSGEAVHSDFRERHFVASKHYICVWSRLGIAIAYTADGESQKNGIAAVFWELATLSAAIRTFVGQQVGDNESVDKERRSHGCGANNGGELLKAAAQVKVLLSRPENAPVRRFFEASHLDEILKSVSDVNVAQTMAENLREVAVVQRAIHVIEYLVAATYSAELWRAIAEVICEEKKYLAIGAATAAFLGTLFVDLINQYFEGQSLIGRFSKWILGALWRRKLTSSSPERQAR